MHEFSLACNIVDYLKNLAGERGMTKVSEIHLEIGDMAHIDPRQLRYSLSMASKGTVAEGTKVYIKRRKVALVCQKCGKSSGFRLIESLNDLELKCPHCGSPDVEIDKGRELTLTRVKGSK